MSDSGFLAPLMLIGGFVPLIYGADRLVHGGSSLAGRFGVPPLVIGLTIVAFGTSTPELVVNLMSALSGETSLALSNVVGSNIFNVLGILGCAALVTPLVIAQSTVRSEIPLMLLSAVLLLVLTLDALWGDPVGPGGLAVIGRSDGLVLLLFFAVFLFYTFGMLGSGPSLENPRSEPWGLSVLWIVLGLGLLILGGKMIVDGAVSVARSLGVTERVIGLTIVAVGTSLPELATSVVAAWKKQPDIAVGNVVGSNIFNAFFILGITATLTPIPISGPETLDLVVNLGASLLLFLFVFTGRGRSVNRWEGGLMVALYGAYVAVLLAL